MFTGIIQSVGIVKGSGEGLIVEGCDPFSPLTLGESIAVDGVCLTVAEIKESAFYADVSEETLLRTTLGEKSRNNGYVNLEPALKLTDRLGGHIVSGHVDGIGIVQSVELMSYSWILNITLENQNLKKYLCEKGSITVNGVSLTVSENNLLSPNFRIAVIPHTWENTALKSLKKSEYVNIEVDIIAKYTENLIKADKNDISKNWLLENGWD